VNDLGIFIEGQADPTVLTMRERYCIDHLLYQRALSEVALVDFTAFDDLLEKVVGQISIVGSIQVSPFW